jgi:hypothetical protein
MTANGKELVFIARMQLGCRVSCRIPGCKRAACAHVDKYTGVSLARAWDSGSSGPFCQQHLSTMEDVWAGCEIRRLAS